MSVFVNIFDGTRICYDLDSIRHSPVSLHHAIRLRKDLPSEDMQLLHNGRPVKVYDRLKENGTYHVILSLKGGKGGFGAMLRMIGAQIEKTTNREACRDLSGRRMRDVNNEKSLQAWIEKKKLQEEERERKRREKLERMRSRPKHYFVDPGYDKQKEDVAESLEEAVSKGFEAAGSSGNGPSASAGMKRKAAEEYSPSDEDDDDDDDHNIKKHCLWLGVEGVEDDSDGEDDNAQVSAKGQESRTSEVTEESTSSPASADGRATEKSSSEGSDETGTSKADSESAGAQRSIRPGANPLPGNATAQSDDASSTTVDLDSFSSSVELEAVGLDRLKSALMERGMKCGGTLQERAQRLFTVKGLEQSQIDPALLAKPGKGKKGKK